MIKKILTMSAGIVLGCMMTTASFAASQDCKDARAAHMDALEVVQDCRDSDVEDCYLPLLRESKRACMRVVRQVCPNGTFADADPFDVAICGLFLRVRIIMFRFNDIWYGMEIRDVVTGIILGEYEDENGLTYDFAQDGALEIYDSNGDLLGTY